MSLLSLKLAAVSLIPSLSSLAVSSAPEALSKRVSPPIDWLPLPALIMMSLALTWLSRRSNSKNTRVSSLAALGRLIVKVALSLPSSRIVGCVGPVKETIGAVELWAVASDSLAVVASLSMTSTDTLGLIAA